MKTLYTLSLSFCFVFGVVFFAQQSHAAPLFGVQSCVDVEKSETPLSIFVERRFKRYLDSDSQPLMYNNEEQLQRWCYLWGEHMKEELQRLEYAKRIQHRRTMEERLYLDDDEDAIKIPDSMDIEFDDLSLSRQAQIQSRVRSQNCSPGSGSQQELEEAYLCKKLLDEKWKLTEDAVIRRRVRERAERRISARALTGVVVRTSVNTASRGVEIVSHVQSVREYTNVNFSLGGSGSKALDATTEQRLTKFVDMRDCSRLRSAVEEERCQWLIWYRGTQQLNLRARANARLQSRLYGSSVLRRTVYGEFTDSTGTSNLFTRSTHLQGVLRVPRTVEEAADQWQDPILLRSDDLVGGE